jgi:membrane fusion protein (multidrug efflux system)
VPQVEGIIRKINFEEGSFVKKGKTLYQINPGIYEASYEKAKLNFKAAQSRQNRYKKLLKVEAVSKQEYEDATAQAAAAKADLKIAKTNLNYSRVAAPISGYIGKSNITEGAIVSPSQLIPTQDQTLTTITQLDPVYVDIVQPSKDAVKFGDQKSIAVSLTIDGVAYPEKGVLKFSEVFVDESTDSVRLRAKFSNKNKKLLPGMFVSATLHLKPIETILVPEKITSRLPDGSLSVLVVENGIVKTRPIKAEQTFEDNWVVTDGLNEGDMVICEGMQKTFDGMKVKPVEKENTAQEAVKENGAVKK